MSWQAMSPEDEEIAHAVLSTVSIIQIDQRIKEVAIGMRRTHWLRLPDSIVAATAVVMGGSLWTYDASLGKLPGVQIYSPPLMNPEREG